MSNGPLLVSLDISEMVGAFEYATKYLNLLNTDIVPALSCVVQFLPNTQASDLEFQAVVNDLLQAFDECDDQTLYGQVYDQVSLFMGSLRFLRDSLRAALASFDLLGSDEVFPYDIFDYTDGTIVLMMKSVPATKFSFPTSSRIIDSSANRRIATSTQGCEPAVHYWL